nr:leucine-rich repeat protein [Eubacterium sp.]
MKKMLFILMMVAIGGIQVSHVEAKTKTVYERATTTIGKFQYDYHVGADGIVINKITPLSDDGISTLKIPKKINGRKVVKLGASRAIMKKNEKRVTNFLGCFLLENGSETTTAPKDVYERVKKIKKIEIPSTVKKITYDCFSHIPDGISINIPKGVNENVEGLLWKANWKKITISSKHKKYKVVQGCFLSKNGKIFYGFAERRKKFVIPKTVKTIVSLPRIYEGAFKIFIPQSVTKIKTEGLSIGADMTIKVAKGSKKFAVENGCLYNKKTGHLIATYVSKDGVLRIPEGVTYVTNFPSYTAKTIVLPASVKQVEIRINYSDAGELVCVAEGRIPFNLSGDSISPFVKLTLCVPVGCKEAYERELKEEISAHPDQITIIEQE